MPKYNVNLSSASLAGLISELKTDLTKLKEKNERYVQEMTDRGLDLVRYEIVANDKINSLSTGELYNSAQSSYDPSTNVGVVEVTAPHAIYVEFGSGVEGKRSPHPESDPSKYDLKGRGEKGWIWRDRMGIAHWTKGQPAAPFFYNARKQLEEEKLSIARRVFKK